AVRVTPKTSFEVAAGRGRTRLNGDAEVLRGRPAEGRARDSVRDAARARPRLTPLTTLAVKYDRIEDRFPLAPVRDTDSYRVMPGVEFKPRALISGFAYVGYRRFSPRAATLPEYSGLVSQVGLSYTMLGSTTFGATVDRDLAFSFEAATPYYVDNGVGVFIRRALAGRWDALATASRHRYDYRDLQVPTFAPVTPRLDV